MRYAGVGDLLHGCLGSLKPSLGTAANLETRLARKLNLVTYPLGLLDSAAVDQQKPELATSTSRRQDRPNDGVGV